VVACAVMGLGPFADIPAEVTMACGALAAAATGAMLLNENGVRPRLMR
jgi:hypothetical protein